MKRNKWSMLALAGAIGAQASLMAPGLADAFPRAAPVLQALALGLTAALGFLRPILERAEDGTIEVPK